MTKVMLRRRSLLTFVLVLAIVVFFGIRLFDIQVVQAADYQRDSAQARTGTSAIYGVRGQIVDSEGVVLATSIMSYDVTASPIAATKQKADTYRQQIEQIGEITGLGAERVDQVLRDALEANPESQYALLVKGVGPEVFEELNDLGVPWLYFTRVYKRSYPDGSVAGNLVGFVSGEGKPQAGVELSQDTCLAETDGTEIYRHSGVDNVQIPGTSQVVEPAKDGGTLELTINADLQWFAQQKLAQEVERLGAQYAFLIVQEVKTGRVLVAAQSTTVDPNNVGATANDFWGARAFSTPFEPGSTFKALTAAMLVDQKKADPTTQVLAPYRFDASNGAMVTDVGFHAPTRLTLPGVLMESSNTGISILGQRLDDKTRYDYMKKLGFGQKTAVDFPGESAGILRPVEKWDNQTKYATMFGQGIAVTPMQMVSAYQALANGGVHLPMRLVDACVDADGTRHEPKLSQPQRVFSEAASKTTLEMMETVSTKGPISGTIGIPGYRIAAKTGTAQQPDGRGGYRSSYYVSVMGAFPVDDPQYVVSANVAYPTTITWSMAAAPLFEMMASQVLKTYRVKPSTEPSPDYSPYY